MTTPRRMGLDSLPWLCCPGLAGGRGPATALAAPPRIKANHGSEVSTNPLLHRRQRQAIYLTGPHLNNLQDWDEWRDPAFGLHDVCEDDRLT